MNSASVSDSFYIVGIRNTRRIDGADLYMLVIYNDEAISRPVTDEGYILLFNNINAVQQVLQVAIKKEGNLPFYDDEISILDLEKAIQLVQDKNIDTSWVILTLLNVFFDILEGIKIDVPVIFSNKLSKFAEHLFLHQGFKHFFEGDNIEREEIINGILWMYGAIMSKSKIV